MKLKISEIKSNPDNPRIIKSDDFRRLVKSITDFPEMSDIRPIVINKEHVILGGNMRFKAMKEAGWKEVPVIIVDWTDEKQREFIIKDNISGGLWDWDLLANEWNTDQLIEWGIELPVTNFDDDDENFDETNETSKNEVIIKINKDDYENIKLELSDILQTVKHSIMS
ncbi:MAG: ParB N-terminal domain-containing protein [bacterium]